MNKAQKYTTRYNGLSTAGKAAEANFTISANLAYEQLNNFSNDVSHSKNEKSVKAKAGLSSTKTSLERQILGLMDSIKTSRGVAKSLANVAMRSDWDTAAAAVIGIELSKSGKGTYKHLTDKNSLQALSSLPESITGLKQETLDIAKADYLRTHHPEIQALTDSADQDYKLVHAMIGVSEKITADYSKYSEVAINDIDL